MRDLNHWVIHKNTLFLKMPQVEMSGSCSSRAFWENEAPTACLFSSRLKPERQNCGTKNRQSFGLAFCGKTPQALEISVKLIKIQEVFTCWFLPHSISFKKHYCWKHGIVPNTGNPWKNPTKTTVILWMSFVSFGASPGQHVVHRRRHFELPTHHTTGRIKKLGWPCFFLGGGMFVWMEKYVALGYSRGYFYPLTWHFVLVNPDHSPRSIFQQVGKMVLFV